LCYRSDNLPHLQNLNLNVLNDFIILQFFYNNFAYIFLTAKKLNFA